MKNNFLNLFLVMGLIMGVSSCKDDKTNEVSATEAAEAKTASAEAIQYEIDTTASEMKWRGTKPTGEHVGTIDIQSGHFTAKDGKIESGTVVIDMNSVAVTDANISDEDRENLENHLKGTVEGKETDFFNVKKFPTATFEITGTTERDGKTFLQGNLTLKDSTKNIEFPVDTKLSNDGKTLVIESERFIIDRTDWGVNYGSQSVFDNLGDNFISDDMELSFNVTAHNKS
ncbi:MAG TPA: YceI family protein [Salinimicrobium sp.]|nr:YceI family protein [Salinimicrobium sp.]